MKIRSGFVSNSSSSSFIISCPNYENKSLEERVELSQLDYRIKDEEEWLKKHPNSSDEDLKRYKEEKEKYIKMAEEENLCVFEVTLSDETDLISIIKAFVKKLPDVNILDAEGY